MRSQLPCIVSLAAVGVVLVGCNHTEAPPPPIPGHLAFVSNRGRTGLQYDIFAMGADGTGLVNLTDSLAYDDWPAWSPDHAKIAFQSDRVVNAAQPLDIFVMNADGTNVVQLTTDTTQERQPAWSPDGAKIAFASNREGKLHIFTMNASDGSGVTRLTTGVQTDAQPAWSPDGTKIAFATNRDINEEVYVMNADGTSPVNLTSNPASDAGPAWSPDGKKIAFMSTRIGGTEQIFVMNADGTGVVQVTSASVGAEYPAWSPDGAYLAFDSDFHIWVAQAAWLGVLDLVLGNEVAAPRRAAALELEPPLLAEARRPPDGHRVELDGEPLELKDVAAHLAFGELQDP